MRTALKRYQLANRLVNGNKCQNYSSRTLKELTSFRAQRMKDREWISFLHQKAKDLVGNVGKCGIGRSLNHWLEKYPQFAQFRNSFGKQTYCEPNFIDRVVQITYNEYNSLTTEVNRLYELIGQEKERVKELQRSYNRCIQNQVELQKEETLEQQAIARKIARKTDLAEARLPLEQEKTEQTRIAETEQTKRFQLEANKPNYIPWIAGGIAAMYLLPKVLK